MFGIYRCEEVEFCIVVQRREKREYQMEGYHL